MVLGCKSLGSGENKNLIMQYTYLNKCFGYKLMLQNIIIYILFYGSNNSVDSAETGLRWCNWNESEARIPKVTLLVYGISIDSL